MASKSLSLWIWPRYLLIAPPIMCWVHSATLLPLDRVLAIVILAGYRLWWFCWGVLDLLWLYKLRIQKLPILTRWS
jgi:hypothetical protein